MTNLFSLEGKLAVVTGARRGLGLAMAKSLAVAGADIIGVSAQLEPEGSEVQRVVEGLGRKFSAFNCDFSNPTEVDSLANELKNLPIDILVNNAGTIKRAPAVEHSMELWNEVLEVNLNSQFRLTRPIAEAMLKQGKGKIVFTASLLSFQGGINVPSYAASKSAIAGLVKALSNEWVSRGVTVNAIVPGYFATDNTSALRSDSERSRSILDRIPAGRWGQPEDIGGATVFLCSDASNYVSGITLPVDGGWLAR
jgi:2-deoxy-D-gluconate 3-dehydrogenase